MVKLIVVLAAAAALLVPAPGQESPGEVAVLDARGEPLRAAFNQATGATRLIALVAPT